jgi:hypothetical protein
MHADAPRVCMPWIVMRKMLLKDVMMNVHQSCVHRQHWPPAVAGSTAQTCLACNASIQPPGVHLVANQLRGLQCTDQQEW